MLIFLLKITSWASFLGSLLNLILHWKLQSLIFIKLLFRSFAVDFFFEQWRTERCHPQIILDLKSRHQISWYRSERIMFQEYIPGETLIQHLKSYLIYHFASTWREDLRAKLYQIPLIYHQKRRHLCQSHHRVIDEYCEWYIIVDRCMSRLVWTLIDCER